MSTNNLGEFVVPFPALRLRASMQLYHAIEGKKFRTTKELRIFREFVHKFESGLHLGDVGTPRWAPIFGELFNLENVVDIKEKIIDLIRQMKEISMHTEAVNNDAAPSILEMIKWMNERSLTEEGVYWTPLYERRQH